MTTTTWEYDYELRWNTRVIPGEEDAFVFVYKTPAGDYAISAMREGDPAGGDVEYQPTLATAKRFADSLISTGRYQDFFL